MPVAKMLGEKQARFQEVYWSVGSSHHGPRNSIVEPRPSLTTRCTVPAHWKKKLQLSEHLHEARAGMNAKLGAVAEWPHRERAFPVSFRLGPLATLFQGSFKQPAGSRDLRSIMIAVQEPISSKTEMKRPARSWWSCCNVKIHATNRPAKVGTLGSETGQAGLRRLNSKQERVK